MEISALAGKPAPRNMLVDLALLDGEYYLRRPDVGDPNQLVSFGTSGHRGSSLRGTFTEAHILAITQAICDYRRSRLLNLGAEARMNLPGSMEDNWRWRCTDEMLPTPVSDRLRGLTTSSNRHS